MEEQEILDKALQSIDQFLWRAPHVELSPNRELDARVTLSFPEKELRFNVEIKNEIRGASLQKIRFLAEREENFLLIAHRIFPKYRDVLQNEKINYIEANGNINIRTNGFYLLIDKYPTLPETAKESNRAFSKTGLRVFFQLLLENKNLFATQRELAEQAGVALGNIPLVLKGLLDEGLLIRKNEFGYQWKNKEEAISRWINSYATTLKPSIFKGSYQLPKENNWQDIPIETQNSCWGGEPGGDILTNYLRPEKYILFTKSTRIDLMKTTRLMPSENGEVKVYEIFWKKEDMDMNAPPLLVYADLILNGDKRSLETAEKIYDRYLQEL
jgi:hypothetical protein